MPTPTTTFEIRPRNGKPIGLGDVNVLMAWSGQVLKPWNNTVVIEVPRIHPEGPEKHGGRGDTPVRALQRICHVLDLEADQV